MKDMAETCYAATLSTDETPSDRLHHLALARDLLKEAGAIVAAIGDDEHPRLRMLMVRVFGEHSFISSVVWQGGRKTRELDYYQFY